MKRALRVLGRIAWWLLACLAGFVAIICIILVIHPEKSGERVGAAVMLVVSGAVIGVCVWGLRRSPRLIRPAKDVSSDVQHAAERRLRAGEPVVLGPSKRRTVLFTLLFVAVAAICIIGFVDSPTVPLGLGAVLCSAGTVLFGVRLVPGRMYLRIDDEGLLVHGPYKVRLWRWNDIAAFRPYEVAQMYGSSTKLVGFARRDVDPRRQGAWKTLNRNLSGVDVTLPDTYGLRHTDLADLLNEAHERYATEFGPSPGDRAMEAAAARVRQDRLPVVTAGLAVACVAVFVLEAARYGVFPSVQELYDAGGATRDALTAGRWWTLLAANVLHANPIHLVLNLFALAIAGWLLERELGWARFALLCVVGGVAAMGGAVLLQGDAVTVGVSGVIFAMTGWALVRDRLATRSLGKIAWGSLPIGLGYTFALHHVSVGAHLGGLLAGVALGYAFEQLPARRRETVLGA